MKIRWFGHACFLFTNSEGKKILTDPFDTSVGYNLPDAEPDIVTISHSHLDHNATHLLKGNPIVVEGEGQTQISNIKISGFKTYHDEEQGKKRGINIIYLIETDNIKILHLGDLGEILSDELKNKLGDIDILCIPVGGVYTIDAEGAKKVVEKLNPKIIIPMHYKTPHLKFDLAKVDEFISKINYPVKKFQEKEIEINKENIPTYTEVWILNY